MENGGPEKRTKKKIIVGKCRTNFVGPIEDGKSRTK